MSTLLQITGSPTQGISVLSDDGVVHTLASTTGDATWKKSASAGAPVGHASLIGVTGYTTLAHSDSLQYLTLLGNPKASWKHVHPPFPQGLTSTAVTGDPIKGFTVVARDGQAVYQLQGAEKEKEWKHLTAPLPFPVAHIAGDLTDGLLLVSGHDPSTLARNGADCCSWHLLHDPAPIKIEFISGDVKNGFVVFGDGVLYTMTLDPTDLTKAPEWILAAHTPDFSFNALSGNPVDGVAALIRDTSGNGKLVVYAHDPSAGPWCLALVAQAER